MLSCWPKAQSRPADTRAWCQQQGPLPQLPSPRCAHNFALSHLTLTGSMSATLEAPEAEVPGLPDSDKAWRLVADWRNCPLGQLKHFCRQGLPRSCQVLQRSQRIWLCCLRLDARSCSSSSAFLFLVPGALSRSEPCGSAFWKLCNAQLGLPWYARHLPSYCCQTIGS